MFGDFNDITSPSEKVGGRSCNLNRISWFQDRIDDCKLLDLGFLGPKFTWKGPQLHGCTRLFERLDRALANISFVSAFPECAVKVLPKTSFSDHNPLSISLQSNFSNKKDPKPFRFEAMWLSHDSFKSFLQDQWNNLDKLESNLYSFGQSLQHWNKEVFGMVERKKRNVLARLNGIQKSSAYPHYKFLCKLESFLHIELEEILKLEEIKLFQKTRTQWINSGDRNTRYYHLKTTMR